MRVSDWSSDVCSSDLPVGDRRAPRLDGSGRSQGELLHRASTSHDDAHSAVGHCNGNTLLAPEICDRAREARDARFDGLFFTGVTSTGIYCRSEEHTSELQSLMRISYAVFCLKKKKPQVRVTTHTK